MQASVVYWLSANYHASGAAVAMDASPAVMMRNAMQKLAKRWKRGDEALPGLLLFNSHMT